MNKKIRLEKYHKCIIALENINNEAAKYNAELLKQYKRDYIDNGYKNLPDRIVAELECV